MNAFWGQFGKAWNLYLKKQFKNYILAFLLGAAAGFILIHLVHMLDADCTSYIYLGSIFAMVFAGTWTFVIASELNTWFLLGVSMGQKRKNLIVSALAFLVLLAAAGYAAVNVLLLLEKYTYPVWFAGEEAEGAWLVLAMQKWGLWVIGVVIFIIWLLFVLHLKYGAKVFWIPYLLYMAAALVTLRLPDTGIIDKMLNKIIRIVSGVTSPVWVMICVAADVFIVIIGSRILMRVDVK